MRALRCGRIWGNCIEISTLVQELCVGSQGLFKVNAVQDSTAPPPLDSRLRGNDGRECGNDGRESESNFAKALVGPEGFFKVDAVQGGVWESLNRDFA